MLTKFNFTKDALSSLPIPASEQRKVYHDAKTTGLQLRVTSTGIKTFSVFRRVKGGAPERMTLGRFPDMTIEQARRLAATVNSAIEDGANPAKVKRAHKSEVTFGEVFTDFLDKRRNKSGKPLSERTKDEYKSGVRLHLGPLKAAKLSQISREDIKRIHAKIGKKAPTQANRIKALVSSVYSYAAEHHGYTGENPGSGIQGYAENQRDRFAQTGELPRLFEALSVEPMRDFFLIALLTGARRSNVMAMRWENVSLEEALWRIPHTKGGKPQNVTLSPEAVAVLTARKDAATTNSPYVFPGRGKSGHLVEPKGGWARVLDRAGISDLRIHDLRRTLGSWQAKTGSSLIIIGKSLNHKSQQSTAIYARLDLDPVRASVNSATAAMMEAAGVKKSAEVKSIKPRQRKSL